MFKRTIVMVILDGWGIGKKDSSNPIHIAEPETINYIKHSYPAGSLQASGIAVGLPWQEEGNSEVGHLTLGGGKIIYQHFPKISLAIKNGLFFKNEILRKAIIHAKENNGNVNLVGLISEGNLHSSTEHLLALIKLAAEEGLEKNRLNLHLFTDGLDGPPKSALNLLISLGESNNRIASLSGRFFAMDKDSHWDKTKTVYETLIGKGTTLKGDVDVSKFFNSFYEQGLTDNFIEPTLLIESRAIKENDSVIFFNFREDGMRQITETFIKPSISGSSYEPLKNTYICTFTQYSDNEKLPVAFPTDKITNPLGKILSDNGKVQLRLAETERYAHVTYFFNGYYEKPFKNEYRVLIPSRNVSRHDEYPEMMAKEITTRAISAISENIYDFILINYANPDVIAHTGNYNATISTIKTIDGEIKKLMKAILETNGVLIITSDHGNAEELLNPRTGLAETKHDASSVPIYIVASGFERNKDNFAVELSERENIGMLSDVAPTILELMGVQRPQEMTGISLLKLLR